MSTNRTPWKILLLAIVIWLAGSYGYVHYSGLTYGDAMYNSLQILLTHINHIEDKTNGAKAVSILLVVASLGLIGYLLKWIAEYMIGIGDSVKQRTMKTRVKKLRNHYIVCGLGRVGSQVAHEMALEGVPFVALDRDPKKVAAAVELGYLALEADSVSEDALQEAGIKEADGLVAGLGEDSMNLFVTLAARSLNPELYIVARANRQENEKKLKRAGADRVAMPYQIGGYHMASMALRPNVVDYMDIVGNAGAATDLQVEEMVVGADSRLAGHHLGHTLTEGHIGATVIAINGSDGTSRVRPNGSEMIYPGDRLIILGAKSDLTRASELIR